MVNMNKIGIIYILKFPNGKVYVGQTIQKFENRLRQHKWNAGNKNSQYYNNYLYNAIRKYGWENIEKEIIFKTNLTRYLDKLELKFQQLYKATVSTAGYNLVLGGTANKAYNKKYKQILCKSNKHLKTMLGKKHKEESKKMISNSLKGHKVSEETRKKLSSKLKGRKQSKEATMKKCIKIACYSNNGDFIKSYNSIKDVKTDGFCDVTAARCARGIIKYHKNHIWKFI